MCKFHIYNIFPWLDFSPKTQYSKMLTFATFGPENLSKCFAWFISIIKVDFNKYCVKKLYNSLVEPILDYGASIWGTGSFICIYSVQHREGRFYLRLGKYVPNCALQGELDWKTQEHKQWLCCIRLWCHLLNMENNRFTKHVFLWAYNKSVQVWRTRFMLLGALSC